MPPFRAIARATLLGTLVAGSLMLLVWLATPTPQPGDPFAVPFAKVFDPPATRAEVMVNRRDGAAFAQLATDLTLDDPSGFDDYLAGSTPSEELAYRAGRPVISWAAALLSVDGRRPLLAPALLFLTLAGLSGAVAVTALAAVKLGRDPSRSWLVLLLPGLGISLLAPGGCEPLALALTLLAWVLWTCDGRTRLPILLWCLAALTRETSLIVPVALALADPGPIRRRAAALILPAATYATWALFVGWRTGEVPSDAGGGRASLLFRGLLDEVPRFSPAEWVALGLLVAFGAAALRCGLSAAGAVIALHVVVASTLGPLVWEQAVDFSRVFVIVQTLGLLALLPRASRPSGIMHGVRSVP